MCASTRVRAWQVLSVADRWSLRRRGWGSATGWRRQRAARRNRIVPPVSRHRLRRRRPWAAPSASCRSVRCCRLSRSRPRLPGRPLSASSTAVTSTAVTSTAVTSTGVMSAYLRRRLWERRRVHRRLSVCSYASTSVREWRALSVADRESLRPVGRCSATGWRRKRAARRHQIVPPVWTHRRRRRRPWVVPSASHHPATWRPMCWRWWGTSQLTVRDHPVWRRPAVPPGWASPTYVRIRLRGMRPAHPRWDSWQFALPTARELRVLWVMDRWRRRGRGWGSARAWSRRRAIRRRRIARRACLRRLRCRRPWGAPSASRRLVCRCLMCPR